MIDHLNIHSVNPFYLVFNKHWAFASADENKEVSTKYTERWNKIKSLIKTIDDKPGERGNNFMKIKFGSDYNLPLNKILQVHNLTIGVRSVFQEDSKYYLQILLDECLYELRKMLQYEITDFSKGIDINRSNKLKESLICDNWYFKYISYKFEPYVCNKCHDISMIA